MGTNKTLMDVDELADYLGVHKATVYRYAQKGKIPGFKIGADWRFHRRSIDKWIKQKEESAVKKTGTPLLKKSGDSFITNLLIQQE